MGLVKKQKNSPTARYLAGVPKLKDFLLPEGSIVVKVELCIHANHISVRVLTKRINFHHGSIILDKHIIECHHRLCRLWDTPRRKANTRGNRFRILQLETFTRQATASEQARQSDTKKRERWKYLPQSQQDV